jgi:hypothetical protein
MLFLRRRGYFYVGVVEVQVGYWRLSLVLFGFIFYGSGNDCNEIPDSLEELRTEWDRKMDHRNREQKRSEAIGCRKIKSTKARSLASR